MNRRKFIASAISGGLTMMTLSSFRNEAESFSRTSRMPVLFVGHGSPMNAIEDNEFSRAWKLAAKAIETPKAILCVSAHWETNGTKVTAMPKPKTIHDFYGFPKELFDKEYPAPGSPELAKHTSQLVHKTNVALDMEWGLDHGTWSVLAPMFPKADIPVFQLSLDRTKPPSYHYELSNELAALRDRGVLIIGSGNIVHNLGMMQWKDEPYDWATEFDQKVKTLILQRDHASLVAYQNLGKAAQLSIPTNEHYLPMLYTLGLREKDDDLSFFAEKATMGSISMRSFRIG
jgi:4,5-DOPA dioxygenase extradiol